MTTTNNTALINTTARTLRDGGDVVALLVAAFAAASLAELAELDRFTLSLIEWSTSDRRIIREAALDLAFAAV